MKACQYSDDLVTINVVDFGRDESPPLGIVVGVWANEMLGRNQEVVEEWVERLLVWGEYAERGMNEVWVSVKVVGEVDEAPEGWAVYEIRDEGEDEDGAEIESGEAEQNFVSQTHVTKVKASAAEIVKLVMEWNDRVTVGEYEDSRDDGGEAEAGGEADDISSDTISSDTCNADAETAETKDDGETGAFQMAMVTCGMDMAERSVRMHELALIMDRSLEEEGV